MNTCSSDMIVLLAAPLDIFLTGIYLKIALSVA